MPQTPLSALTTARTVPIIVTIPNIAPATIPIIFIIFWASGLKFLNQSTKSPTHPHTVSIAGANASNRAVLSSVTAVWTGNIDSANSACASTNFCWASAFSLWLSVASSYTFLPSPYAPLRVSVINFALSFSELQLSNFLLKSSSEIPAQFNASAKLPVTCPTWTVSVIDSVNPSIGILSP